VRLDVRRIDHLRLARSTSNRQLPEKLLPDAAFGPPRKAIVDRRVRAVLRRAILPSTAASQHMQDAADHPPIVRPFLAAYVARQMQLDLLPLMVVKPE
jgi:hypothetical protein